MIDITASKSRLVFRPLPSDDPKQRQPDISLVEATFGWRPKIALREGLVQTIAYFDQLIADKADAFGIGGGKV